MKTKCTEGSIHGEHVTCSFYFPSPLEYEEGEEMPAPDFTIDCLDLLCAVEDGTSHDTVGMFCIDALAVFMDESRDEESADIVAEWLESAAKQVRDKFKAPL
jgi:hypothetical protein